MRVTKTRLMRDKTINPNPPICRSKEPSFTFITIYSCATDEVLDRIQHYNWNLTQARAAANGGEGTYSLGYMYETAFKKYTSLNQKHCPNNNWIELYNYELPGMEWGVRAQAWNTTTNYGGIFDGGPAFGTNPGWPNSTSLILTGCEWETQIVQRLYYTLTDSSGFTLELTTPIHVGRGYTPIPPNGKFPIETCDYIP